MNPTSDPLGLSDPLRNPERLTAAQLGEGYRTLTVEERAIPDMSCEAHWDSFWGPTKTSPSIAHWTLRCPTNPPTGTPSDAESILGPQRPMTPDERAALDSFTSKELQPQPESEVKPCRTSPTTSACNTPVAVQSGDAGELKPCPFCLKQGHQVFCDPQADELAEDVDAQQKVVCNYLTGGCGASSAVGSSRGFAMANWNTRVEPPELAQLRAENAYLRSQVEELAKDKDFLQKSMERICALFDIHHPFQLMGKAKNNEQTYTDILLDVIAERLAQPAPTPDSQP